MTDTYTPNNSALILSNGTAIKEGDTKTEFQIKLSDIDNQPIDLTGATVQVYFSSLLDNLLLFYKTATISETPTDGTISFHFDNSDMTGNGVIRLQFNVIYSDGSIEKFPTNDYITILINPSLDNLENTAISTYSMQQIIDYLTETFTNSLNSAKTELQNNLNTHTSNKNNPHVVTKAQVGLGNADNTSDINKPVSNAQQAALNAKVDDIEVSTTATANKLLKLDSNSKLPASITGNADGNAATATKLQAARTIGASGDATGTATSFDGSANITIPLTLVNSGVTAGTYKSVTVDVKGRVTSGTNPTTLSGYGITDAPKKYTTQIGDGTATSYVITHNLNTQNCFVSVRQVSSPYGTVSPATIQMTTVNTITLTFATAPTINQYQVTVIG